MTEVRLTTARAVFLALALLVMAGLAVFVSLTAALVTAIFAASFLLDLDAAVPLSIALTLLILSAIMVLADLGSTADNLASWAYWFLAAGVAVLLWKHLASLRRED
jgi:hypothetical protein